VKKKKSHSKKKQLASNTLFEIEKRFDVNKNLKKVVFENSEGNMIYMKFGTKEYLSLKFECDFNRERFKQELTVDLISQQWSKMIKNSSDIKIIRQTPVEEIIPSKKTFMKN